MNIGKNIKKLRISKDMTQEELASFLNISSRAVSRWENGITYPDITLLPVIANLFSVTVDELLDVNIYEKEKDIKDIFSKNSLYKHSGEMEKSIELLQDGLKKYPDNYEIMNQLLHSLFMYYYNKNGERRYLLNEIIELGEKIVNDCKDNKIKSSATQVLIFTYVNNNEIDKAKNLVNKQPSIYLSKEILLENILKGDELINLSRSNLLVLSELFHSSILQLNYNIKDIEIQIKLIQKYIDFMTLLFDDTEMGFYNRRLIDSYLLLSKKYMKLDMKDKVIDCLIKAINYAINVETFKVDKASSLLLDGVNIRDDDSQTNSTLTNKEIINMTIESKVLENIKNYDRYTDVKNLLSKLK